MKTLLTLLICLFSFNSWGQQTHLKISPNSSIKYYDLLIFLENGLNAQVSKGSDTLEITSTGKIKFIKIGGRIYKIESPTLTEVKPDYAQYSIPLHAGGDYIAAPYEKIDIDALMKKLTGKQP